MGGVRVRGADEGPFDDGLVGWAAGMGFLILFSRPVPISRPVLDCLWS